MSDADTDFDPDGPGSVEDGLYGLGIAPEDAAVTVIPVPFEATASFRRGTRDGPAAVLEASTQIDLTDLETGEPWREGIAMLPLPESVIAWDAEAAPDALAVIEAGGPLTPALVAATQRVDAISERVNRWVADRAREVIARGGIPAVLGGDHSVPFGAMAAVAERWPGVGVLHVDAHADLRAAYEGFTWSHASILYNALTRLPDISRVVQVGVRDVGRGELDFLAANSERVTTWFDPDIAWGVAGGASWRELAEGFIEGLPEHVYVSFDIDGLEPALCPHTGTPVPGGLSWQMACVLLRVLGTSGRRIVGFDLCEVAPGGGEFAESWDANVGARLLYKLAGWALASR